MLEALAKAVPLADEVAMRAALYLARDHGRDDLRDALLVAARDPKREELRGVAVAALWDLGMAADAQQIADELVESKVVGNVAWGALVRAAGRSVGSPGYQGDTPRAPGTGVSPGVSPPSGDRSRTADDDVLTETPFRWIQWGWLE